MSHAAVAVLPDLDLDFDEDVSDAEAQRRLDAEAEALAATIVFDSKLATKRADRSAWEEPTPGRAVLVYIDELEHARFLWERHACRVIAQAASVTADGPQYDQDDVLGWLDRATEQGWERPTFGHSQALGLLRHDLVPNAALRRVAEERIAAEETSYVELARRAGFLRTREGEQGAGDGTRVERLLGVVPTRDRYHGRVRYQPRVFVTYEQAVALQRALGVDPHEVGV